MMAPSTTTPRIWLVEAGVHPEDAAMNTGVVLTKPL